VDRQAVRSHSWSRARERKQPAYLAINPAGAVPALVVDGWILTQNVPILNYLADKNPEARLGGDGTPESRADRESSGCRWSTPDVHPLFKSVRQRRVPRRGGPGEECRRHNRAQRAHACSSASDKQLEGKQWWRHALDRPIPTCSSCCVGPAR
jgi:glutathione S-transferase